MAPSVGIRELKNRAAELVRRAAAGERIVVSRHGRIQAVLGPPESTEAASPSRRMGEWLRERAAFEAMEPALRRRLRGRWVAVHAGKVVASDLDLDRLSRRAGRKLQERTFFVGRVGHPPALVEIPGFEVA